MKKLLIAGLLMGSYSGHALLADDSAMDESDIDFMIAEKCTACHDNDIYTSDDRKIKSLQSLGSMVRACNTQTGAQWFDEEVDIVIDYLNKHFYKFEKES